MGFVPIVKRREGVGTGVSQAGIIPVSALQGLHQAQTEFGEAVADLGEGLVAIEDDADQRRRKAEDEEWITATSSSATEKWTLGLIEAQSAAPEGAPEFSPKFMQTYDDWVPTVLDQAPSGRARRELSGRFDVMRDKLWENSMKFEAVSGRVQRMASFSTSMDNYASSAAIDSSLAMDVIAAAQNDLAAAESTWMLPSQVTEFRQAIPSNIAASAFMGDIAKDPQGVIDTINASKPADGSLAGHLNSDQRRKLLTSSRAAVNQRKTATTMQKTEIRLEIADLNTVVSAGGKISVSNMNELEKKVTLTDDPKLAVSLRDLKLKSAASQELVTFNQGQLTDFIGIMEDRVVGKEASVRDASILELARDMQTEMNKELRTNPLGWAERGGQKIEPIKFSGDDAIESMKRRKETAGGVADYYGIAQRNLTIQDERELTRMLASANAGEKIAIMSNIVQGFGDQATNVFGRVSQDNRMMAHAGGLTSMGPIQAKYAVELVNGQEAIKDGIEVLPAPTELNQWSAEYFNGAMSMIPPTMTSVMEAAKAIYTDRAVKSPPTSGDGQRNLWEASIDAAIGGYTVGGFLSDTVYGSIGDFGGFGVVMPEDINNSQFSKTMNAASDGDLSFASVGGAQPVLNDAARTPLTADILRKSRLSSIGQGQYIVDLTGVGQDFVLGSGQGGLYVLDYSMLQKSVELQTEARKEGGGTGKEPISHIVGIGGPL